MKEELTAAMHSEFEISNDGEKALDALSLLEMERDGIDISERVGEYGFTEDQFKAYRKRWAHLFAN